MITVPINYHEKKIKQQNQSRKVDILTVHR